MRTIESRVGLLVAAALLAAALSACGHDKKTAPRTDAGANTDSGSSKDAGKVDAGSSDCFEDPKTYNEIINACTDAEEIDKHPTLPLLLPDGGLPKLP